MSSIKQIEANRRNAGKSTGPRTTEARFVVAANALKHSPQASDGIFARRPAIVDENSFPFSDIKDALRHRFERATPERSRLASTRLASKILVSTIARNACYLERIARIEVPNWG